MRAFILLLAAGCASGAASSRSVTFKSFANQAARPFTVSVGTGHVVGADLNAYLDKNCVRGNYALVLVNFCREDKGEGPVQHWAGSSGAFTVRPEGEQVAVDGYWQLDTGRTVSMTQIIPLGQGAGWEELKKNPALLAVAATAADLRAVGISR